MAYADDINLLSDDIRTVKRISEVLLNACKDVGLAVNMGKTKYMEIGRNQGMIANEHIKIGIVLYSIDGVVIAAQFTATFLRSIVLPKFRYY